MDRRSLWHATASLPSFPALPGDARADVAIVGGGVAGLTAALLLQRAGRRTVLVEAWRVASRETGHSTAHLTEILDARYHALESSFGRDGAARAAASSRAALDRVEALAGEIGARACGFARVPGYLAASSPEQRRDLEQELEAMRRAGVEAAWSDSLPYPLEFVRALRVERQAQLHPVAYAAGLARLLGAAGGRIHEQTRATEIHDGTGGCRIETGHGTLRAGHALVLTNQPVSSRFAIHTKIAAYRTYAIALGPIPRERFPAALVYDMVDPYHYVRTQETADGTFLVVGGEDHKTGHERHARARFASLEAWSRRLAPDAPVAHRWSGQIVEPADGLPFIGRSPGADRVLVASGFSGNGITLGTLAGELLAQEVLGAPGPSASLYDARRVRPLAQARRFLAENADVAAAFARDRLSRGEVASVEDVPAGEGRLVRSGGRMLAVSRDASGALRIRSAVCRHLGCHVQWNDAEGSWDCPCHGSRYDAAGAVLNGPTTRPLDEEEGPGVRAADEGPPA